MRAFEQQGWTDERIAMLRGLVSQHLTAEQIAGIMGGISRSAVLGKVYRMGIGMESASRPSLAKPRRRTREPLPRTVIQFTTIDPRRNGGGGGPVHVMECTMIDLPPDQSEFACSIVALGSVTDMCRCRWPLGMPAADMRYCGAPSEGPWCSRHKALAYRPAGRGA